MKLFNFVGSVGECIICVLWLTYQAFCSACLLLVISRRWGLLHSIWEEVCSCVGRMANLYSGVAYGGCGSAASGGMVSSSSLTGVSNVGGGGISSAPLASSGRSASSPGSISHNGAINLVGSAAPVLLQQQQQPQQSPYADPRSDHRLPPAATVPRLDLGFGAVPHQPVSDQQLAQQQLQHLQQQPQQFQQLGGFLPPQQALPHPLPQLVGAPALQQSEQQAGSSALGFGAPPTMPPFNGVGGTPHIEVQPLVDGQQGLRLMTISQLTPFSHRWKIVARVSKKNAVKPFNFKRREGQSQLFSVELVDASGETRGTFFGPCVETYYDMLQERKVYSFSGGRLKVADKRWCNHDCEITFDEKSQILPVLDNSTCPQFLFDFKRLSSLSGIAPNSTVDVAAVVINLDEPDKVNLKAGGSKRKQNVTLLDDSGAKISLSLWGEELITRPWREASVVLLKSVKTSDYGGCSLNSSIGSIVILGEEAKANERGRALADWYGLHGIDARGHAIALTRVGGVVGGPEQTIAEMKEDTNSLVAGSDGTKKYHTVPNATVTWITHERAPYYHACPFLVPDERAGEGKTRACNRKVERNGESWSCCMDHISLESCPRWIANFKVCDHSGEQYVSVFDDIGTKFLGCTAAVVAELWEKKDDVPEAAERIEQIFKEGQFKRWRLRIQSKKEVWNDEERIKYTVMECTPLSLVTDGRQRYDEVKTALSLLAQPAGA